MAVFQPSSFENHAALGDSQWDGTTESGLDFRVAVVTVLYSLMSGVDQKKDRQTRTQEKRIHCVHTHQHSIVTHPMAQMCNSGRV
jgi:hypothetical protein